MSQLFKNLTILFLVTFSGATYSLNIDINPNSPTAKKVDKEEDFDLYLDEADQSSAETKPSPKKISSRAKVFFDWIKKNKLLVLYLIVAFNAHKAPAIINRWKARREERTIQRVLASDTQAQELIARNPEALQRIVRAIENIKNQLPLLSIQERVSMAILRIEQQDEKIREINEAIKRYLYANPFEKISPDRINKELQNMETEFPYEKIDTLVIMAVLRLRSQDERIQRMNTAIETLINTEDPSIISIGQDRIRREMSNLALTRQNLTIEELARIAIANIRNDDIDNAHLDGQIEEQDRRAEEAKNSRLMPIYKYKAGAFVAVANSHYLKALSNNPEQKVSNCHICCAENVKPEQMCIFSSSCGPSHALCDECVKKIIISGKGIGKCPICRAPAQWQRNPINFLIVLAIRIFTW